jgi:hypothetical protein
MKITRIITNHKSEDMFESLVEFDDGYVIAGSEKDIIVVSHEGVKVGDAHKAILDEPHAIALQDHVERHGLIGDDFTDAELKQWLGIMGPHAGIPRDGQYIKLREGELVSVK